MIIREVFGTAIRKCVYIEGLKLPGGREVRISQFADDNTCIGVTTFAIFKVLAVFKLYMGNPQERGSTNPNRKNFGLVVGKYDLKILVH